MAIIGPESNSIDSFKGNFLDGMGLSKPTKFAVDFSPIANQVTNRDLTLGSFVFQPEAVSFPGRSLVSLGEHFFSAMRKIPSGQQFDGTVTMSFPVSENQRERSFFEAWMDSYVDPHTGFADGRNESMRGREEGYQFVLYTLDSQSNPTSRYFFYGGFPSSITPSNFGAGMINDYTRLQVLFDYRKYEFESEEYVSRSGSYTL